MPERLWIPADYVDEVTPPGRANPDAWIASPAADVWYVAAAHQDVDPGPYLAVGQVVEFAWGEDHGDLLIEFNADGSHVARGAVPRGVTHFTSGNDVLADTLDEFVAEWKAVFGVPARGESVLVRMTSSSTEPERFQFDVTDAGPRFIRANPPREPAIQRAAP